MLQVAPAPARPLTDTAVFVSVKEDVAGVEIRDQVILASHWSILIT